MLERILWSSLATPVKVVAAWRAMRVTSSGWVGSRPRRSRSLMVGSVAMAMAVTQAASCSIDTAASALSSSRSEMLGEAGEAHEGAEELLAVLGPVLGVGDAAAGDGLGEGPAGAQRPRGGGDGRERGPAGGGQVGGGAGVEHGDLALAGAHGGGGVVEVAFDGDGDDGPVPGGDGGGGERGLAGPGGPDESDRTAVALAAGGPAAERVADAVFGGEELAVAGHPSEQHPPGGWDDVVDGEGSYVGRAWLRGLGCPARSGGAGRGRRGAATPRRGPRARPRRRSATAAVHVQ